MPSDRRQSRVQVWRTAIIDSALSSSAKLVGCVLARYFNASASECYPSLASIAERASLSRPTVIKALEVLKAAGFVVVVVGKGRKLNRYLATFPCDVEVKHVDHKDVRSPETLELLEEARRKLKSGRAVNPLDHDDDPLRSSPGTLVVKTDPVAVKPKRRSGEVACPEVVEVDQQQVVEVARAGARTAIPSVADQTQTPNPYSSAKDDDLARAVELIGQELGGDVVSEDPP